jgi:hypothetical protein
MARKRSMCSRHRSQPMLCGMLDTASALLAGLAVPEFCAAAELFTLITERTRCRLRSIWSSVFRCRRSSTNPGSGYRRTTTLADECRLCTGTKHSVARYSSTSTSATRAHIGSALPGPRLCRTAQMIVSHAAIHSVAVY